MHVQSDGLSLLRALRTPNSGLPAALAKMIINSRSFQYTSLVTRRVASTNSKFRVVSLKRRCEPRMNDLAQRVVHKLTEKKVIFTSVESCTGGLLAHLITNVGGAAQVFWGSVVTYDGSFKRVWGVQSTCILDFPGTVSEQAAREMAEGGLRNMMKAVSEEGECSDLINGSKGAALSITGFAGAAPQECDNGLCYVGLAITGQDTRVKCLHAEGDDRIRHKDYFAKEAFDLLLNHIS